jgi:hypothetical protein
MSDQHPINRERAQRVENALAAANYWDHGEDYAVTDILGDIRHLCDREGWDFDDLIERSISNYRAEVEPDDLEEMARQMHARGEYPIL